MIRKRIIITLRIITALVLVGGLCLLVFSPAGRVHRQYPKRQKVVFWHMWTAEWKVVVDRIVDRFNKSQDEYEVVALSVPTGGSAPKLLMGVAGGDPPDVMAQWEGVIPSWATRKALLPLDTLMSEEELREFRRTTFPIIWKVGAFERHLYGLCVGLNMFALYYRPSHFTTAGLDPNKPPRTIEELDAIGGRLYKRDKNGNLLRIGFFPTVIMPRVNFISSWTPCFGGSFYDEANGHLTINTPENMRTLRWLRSYTERYGLDRILRFTSSLQSGTSGDMDWPFITGAFSMVLDGQWRVEQLAKYAPELDYRTAPIPPAASGGRIAAGYSNGNYMVIPAGAKCPKGAWKFMRFWSGLDNPTRAAEFYTWGGWLPINQQIVDAPAYQQYIRKYPQFKTFVDLLPSPNLQVAPPVTYQNYFIDRLSEMEQQVIRLSLSPETAMRRLEQEMTIEAEKSVRNRP